MYPSDFFRANGKVLLSGEYLVLHGASALAVPLKIGQVLHISEGNLSSRLAWTASDVSGVWFNGLFALDNLEIVETTDNAIALRLKKLLLSARLLNPVFLSGGNSVNIQTTLEFDRNWGFGSSSSLIALIAQMAKVDATELHSMVSEGSGYDVACALSSTPILFSRTKGQVVVSPVDFRPPFIRQLFLVYLGKKQNSESEVIDFKARSHNFTPQVSRISEISMQMVTANKIEAFMDLMLQHESLMESVLGKESVMKRLFPDFEGAVKSLGAWGGDFVLAASSRDGLYVHEYFNRKSLNVIYPFGELTLVKEPQTGSPVL